MVYSKDYVPHKRLCFLDLETTGKFWNSCVPIQIAAIITDEYGKIISEFDERINPLRKIPDEVVELTGITNEQVKYCRTEKEVYPDFIKWLDDNQCDCLVTYNGRVFDLPILNLRYGICRIDSKDYFNKESPNALPHIDGYYDCVFLAKKKNLFGLKDKLGRKWKLTLVSENLNINPEGAHNALIDSTMLRSVFFTIDPYIHPLDWTDHNNTTFTGSLF